MERRARSTTIGTCHSKAALLGFAAFRVFARVRGLTFPRALAALAGVALISAAIFALLRAEDPPGDATGVGEAEAPRLARTEDGEESPASSKRLLVVGCDGVGSWVRDALADELGPQVDVRRNKFVWLGTTVPFTAFTFIFKETAFGLFRVHAYRYSETGSTFIVECTPETWRAAGLEGADEDHTIDRPRQYELWRDFRPPGWPGRLLDWTVVRPDTLEPLTRGLFEADDHHPWWTYRRILDRTNFDKGFAPVPDSPGLGVELNDEVAKAHIRPGSKYFEPTTEWDTQRANDRLWS